MLLYVLLIHVLLATTCYSAKSYTYWSQSEVELTNLFKIDHENKLIILAAKNNICHLTLDLRTSLNAQNATPNATKKDICINSNAIFQPPENCQNFHHILHIPKTDVPLTLDDGSTVPLDKTILVCGSDAYQPRCFYRNRTDLSIIASYNGRNFCPYDQNSVSTSILSSNGNLVSGTSLNAGANIYGLTMSHSPFNGTASVSTINYYISFNEPEFIDLYERGDHYYFFMRETARETGDVSLRPIYSRVGRICKNDTGITNILAPASTKVFDTYLKARIMCQSTFKSSSDFPYTFNDLQDTVHIMNGTVSSTLSGEYLYGVFTSPENGPAGSAICVYSFDAQDGLSDVFTKSYLAPTALNEWVSIPNNNPVTCNGPKRNFTEARDKVLMMPPVAQVGDPLTHEDGLLYKKLLVDQVVGVDGVKYDVLLIAATSSDNLHLLKKTYVSSRQGNKDFTSQNVELERDTGNGEEQVVGMMELYKSGSNTSVYVSTSEGLYVVPLDNCSALYPTCSECISSRDPYCAYNVGEKACVSTVTSGGVSNSLLQDIVNGNTTNCPTLHSSTSVTPSPTLTTHISPSRITPSHITSSSSPSTSISEITIINTQTVTVSSSIAHSTSSVSSGQSRTLSSSPPVITAAPTAHGVNNSKGGIEEHTEAIVAGAGGLIVGVVVGFLLFALLINKNRFCWGKFLPSRRRRYHYDDDQEKGVTYELSAKHGDYQHKNNATEYTKVPQRSTTPPLTKLNPAPNKITDSPVLSKYTNTGRTHNRSQSFGGQFLPSNGIAPHPVSNAPMGNNLRATFHVDEPVPNAEYEKYGHNMVGRQLSKEYPMVTPNRMVVGSFPHHVKTNSLDLDNMFKL